MSNNHNPNTNKFFILKVNQGFIEFAYSQVLLSNVLIKFSLLFSKNNIYFLYYLLKRIKTKKCKISPHGVSVVSHKLQSQEILNYNFLRLYKSYDVFNN